MIAQVALPLLIPKTFTYRIPRALEPFVVGRARVTVPFAKRLLKGLVIAVQEDQKDDDLKLSDIHDVIDLEPIIDSICFDLCLWAAHYYCMPVGLALKSMFPFSLDVERYVRVSTTKEDLIGLNGVRLKRAYGMTGKEKVRESYVSGFLDLKDIFTNESLKLSQEQKGDQEFSATIFEGEAEVRWEYYLSLALPVLNSGRNVLLFLPDRSLAGEYSHRLISRKIDYPVLSFGGQTTAKGKAEIYLRTRRQGGLFLIGTRSGLFLPAHRTGLIIVERPEDDAYRNDQALLFNTVTMATKLAVLCRVPIHYGSVSPPLDLMRGVDEGRIHRIDVKPPKRPPTVVNVKKFRKGVEKGTLSELTDLVIEGVGLNQRIAIHTPLKDYGARLYCLACRKPVVCPFCGSSLSFSKRDKHLSCWKCGCHVRCEESCKECGSEMISFGSIGAEYVEEQINNTIPGCSVTKATGHVIRNEGMNRPGELWKTPGTIVVGTQVLSKVYGSAVDRLILIGWEDYYRIGGYRATERIFQMYSNLLDALRPSTVYLLVVQGAKDPSDILTLKSEDFYKRELEQRRVADFPPYSRLFLIKIEARTGVAAQSIAKRARDILEKHDGPHHIIGEVVRPSERAQVRILVRNEESLPVHILDELFRLRHIRIEADPAWV